MRRGAVLCVVLGTAYILLALNVHSYFLYAGMLASVGHDLHFESHVPVWRRWALCWANGTWDRLSESSATDYRQNGFAFTIPSPAAADNYTWTVHSAALECDGTPFVKFDRLEFCRVLNGRTIFIVGDSLSRRLSDSLEMLASPRHIGGKMSAFSFPYRTSVYNVTICADVRPAEVRSLLNWFGGKLELSSELRYRNVSSACGIDVNGGKVPTSAPRACRAINVVPGSASDRIWGVDEFIEPLPGAIVILNQGMHYEPTRKLVPRLHAIMSLLTARLPSDATIIWRNTAPGHANCSLYSAPLLTPQTGPLPNQWRAIVEQNSDVEQVIATFPRAIYWDIATSTALRADMHTSAMKQPKDDGDCAHYVSRAPSPVDSWVRGLFNVLRMKSLGATAIVHPTRGAPLRRSLGTARSRQ